MRGPAVQPIVIAAGGTGGHFFPAEALAAELLTRGHRIVLMTDARSGARTSPVFANHEQHVIKGAGIAGRGILRAAKALAALAAGIVQARAILANLQPALIVGFGGYPCVAPILAARLLRRRPAIILHEQNAVLGRANRFLARGTTNLALTLGDTGRLPKCVPMTVTGNPVRPAVAALAATAYEPPTGRIYLLILGGSLGARIFSDIVPAALAELPNALKSRLSVVQQCRTEDLDRVRTAYAQDGIAADLSPFFPEIAARLATAHLVIARAGASTVAEITVAGRPSILVPLPGAIDDHQTANATALASRHAAWIMPQPAFTQANLATSLTTLLSNPAQLTAAAAAARAQARPDAAARLADLVERRLLVTDLGPRT